RRRYIDENKYDSFHVKIGLGLAMLIGRLWLLQYVCLSKTSRSQGPLEGGHQRLLIGFAILLNVVGVQDPLRVLQLQLLTAPYWEGEVAA
ncbi:MAG: hypothetical protein Q9211_006296, partial [Gyalolechia sp. 1 TL-2023]